MLKSLATALSCGVCIVAVATPAQAQTRVYRIPAGSLKSALDAYARQSGRQVIYKVEDVRRARSSGASGNISAEAALDAILSGTGFRAQRDSSGALAIVQTNVAGSPSAGEAIAGSRGSRNAENDIVVTGSRIRNREAVASPLTTYSREAIQQTARTDVSDFLQTIPLNFSGGSFGLTPDGVLGGGFQRLLNTTGATSPNLRGLGPGSTLTLVNGHRVATAAGSAFVDVGAIPLNAIERVDIVADGASAVYGGEAVGGVVNFILRKSLKGAETNVSYELADEGDYSNFNLAQSFGADWTTGSFLVSGNYRDRNDLEASQRPFSRKLGVFNTNGLVLSPQLYPDQKEYSALAVVRQELGDDVEGSIDTWYSRRDQRQVSGGAGNFALFEPTAQQFSINGSLDAKLFGSLRANMHGGYSISREDVSQENYTQGVGRAFSLAGDQDFDLWYANANVSGDIIRLPGGELSFAAGAEHREEDFTFDFTSTFGPVFRNGSRNVSSAYAELLIPVVGQDNALSFLNRASLSLAGRYDHYSDVGDAWTGKVGLVVDVLSGVRLRGTYSSAFRAPTVDDFTRSGVSSIIAENILFLSPTHPGNANVIDVRGFADLKPEKAKIFTAGLEVRPKAVSGLFASVTYFNYDYKDRLTSVPLDADLLLRPEVFGDLFRPVSSVAEIQTLVDAATASGGFVLFFDPSIPLSSYEFILDLRFRNLAVQKVHGLDFDLRYGFDVGDIRLEAQGAATYVLKDERRISASSVPEDFVGHFAEQPDLKLRAQLTARAGGFTATGAVNHLSSFENTNVAGSPRIDPFTTVDINLQYLFAKGFAGGTTTLGFAVRNLFDEAPPFVQRSVNEPNYDPANANPLGRIFSVRLNHRW